MLALPQALSEARLAPASGTLLNYIQYYFILKSKCANPSPINTPNRSTPRLPLAPWHAQARPRSQVLSGSLGFQRLRFHDTPGAPDSNEEALRRKMMTSLYPSAGAGASAPGRGWRRPRRASQSLGFQRLRCHDTSGAPVDSNEEILDM